MLIDITTPDGVTHRGKLSNFFAANRPLVLERRLAVTKELRRCGEVFCLNTTLRVVHRRRPDCALCSLMADRLYERFCYNHQAQIDHQIARGVPPGQRLGGRA
jgi:hypothetical protein